MRTIKTQFVQDWAAERVTQNHTWQYDTVTFEHTSAHARSRTQEGGFIAPAAVVGFEWKRTKRSGTVAFWLQKSGVWDRRSHLMGKTGKELKQVSTDNRLTDQNVHQGKQQKLLSCFTAPVIPTVCDDRRVQPDWIIVLFSGRWALTKGVVQNEFPLKGYKWFISYLQ